MGPVAPTTWIGRRNVNAWTAAGWGAGLGFLWGVAARLWMRFISTNPEFTWSGTGYIVLAPTLIAVLLGVAVAARRRGGKGWARAAVRIPAGLSVLLLGVGAGVLMVPSIVLGGLALFRSRYPWALRAVLALAMSLVVVVGTGRGSGGFPWILLGGLALALLVLTGRGIRIALGLAALPTLLAVAGSLYEDLSPGRATAGLLIYLVLLGTAVLGYGWAMGDTPVGSRHKQRGGDA
jgi:hypothetical protein